MQPQSANDTTGADEMHAILGWCIEIDLIAARAYRQMAAATADPDLEQLFTTMGREEGEHLSWWHKLSSDWDAGLIPTLFGDTSELAGQLSKLVSELEADVPHDFSDVSDEEMLTVAAKVEYFALEPVFSELMTLLRPTSDRPPHELYDEHIERLIAAIEQRTGDLSLASFLVRALRRAWINNNAMTTYAMRDHLTGLYNRRALDAHLAQWSAWSTRYGRPLSVCALDIDDFKSINDTYGHAIGDRALVAVADALREAVRASDIVARFGGDEFLILAPETGRDELELVAQRVLDRARAVSVPVPRGEARVSTSLGAIVVQDPAGSPARSNDALLTSAAGQLYEAKSLGKNRFVYASLPPAGTTGDEDDGPASAASSPA